MKAITLTAFGAILSLTAIAAPATAEPGWHGHHRHCQTTWRHHHRVRRCW